MRQRGRITSVIGPNGAGKSSLFNLISGAHPARAGRVVFDGADVTGAARPACWRAGLARSFQITNLFFELTGAREPAPRRAVRSSPGASLAPRRRAQPRALSSAWTT